MKAFLIIALALLGSSTAFADCTTPDEVAANIIASHPDAVVKEYSGPKADAIANGVSVAISGPVGKGNTFVVAQAPNLMTVYIVLIERGCASRHGQFPLEMFMRWIGESAG